MLDVREFLQWYELFKHLASFHLFKAFALGVFKVAVEVKTVMYLFMDKNGYEAIEKVETRSEAVQNV